MDNSQEQQPVIRNKKHHNLTAQQITYLRARIEGKSKEDAKKEARYSKNTSTYTIEHNPNMRLALLDCFKERGITEQFLADKLYQGMQVKKTQYFTKDGVVTDERSVDDNDVQFKYFTKALEVRGDVKSSAIEQLNIGLISVPTVKDDNEWNNPDDKLNELPSEKQD